MTFMKKIFVLLAIGWAGMPMFAQTGSNYREIMDIFTNEIKEKYYNFRDSCNKVYADAIRGEWKSQTAEEAVQKPKDEKFTPLKVELPADNTAKPTNSLLKVTEYAPAKAKPQPSPKDIDNLPTNKPVYAYDKGDEVVFMVEGQEIPTDAVVELEKKNSWLKSLFRKKKTEQKDKKKGKKKSSSVVEAEPIEPYHTFTFYGTDYKVRLEPKHISFRLPNIYPETIAKQWEKFSVSIGHQVEQAEKSRCTNLLYDCLMLRKEYDLCDWAYLNMLYQMSASFLGKGTNEATFLTAFLYCQSGYKIRMASNRQGKLYILVASDHYIYDNPPFNIDGTRFFAFLPEEGDGQAAASLSLNICQAAFKDEQALSLLIPHAPKLDIIKTNARELISLHNKEMKALVSTNKNRVDFFNNYPSSYVNGNFMTRWAMYANTPLSEEVKAEFYPKLKESIEGCSKARAVSVLLEFCQSAFEYKYDEEVWGGDRAFFAEETLYYPYSDCEDRSILFSRLVRDLVGLDVLLVYYPGHLLTAVHFPEDAQLAAELRGEYFSLPCDGRNFVICDPTGLYAPIGWNDAKYRNTSADVILLE